MLFLHFLALAAVATAAGRKPTSKPPVVKTSIKAPPPGSTQVPASIAQSSSPSPVASLSSTRSSLVVVSIITSSGSQVSSYTSSYSALSSSQGTSSFTAALPSSSSVLSLSSSGSPSQSTGIGSTTTGSSSTSTLSSSTLSSQTALTSSTAPGPTSSALISTTASSSSVSSSTTLISTLSSSSTSSTTSSSTATSTSYIVYPKKGSNKVQTAKIKTLLSNYVTDKNSLYESVTNGLGVNYWKLPLSNDNVTALAKNSDIASVTKAGCDTTCFDPTTFIVKQRNAADEMVFLSQRQGTTLDMYNHRYIYERGAARNDITVYVVDTGADLGNEEFTSGANVARRARWLFANPNDQVRGDNGPKWHGTCMLSKITGHLYGTSKRVNPVIVKVPLAATVEDYLEGVSKVVDDVRTRGGRKTVLNLSWYYPGHVVESKVGWSDRLYELLKELQDSGVIIVAGSGNGGRPTMDGFPATFGGTRTPNRLQHMIVVSALDAVSYDMYVASNYDNAAGLPHVFAPGSLGMQCADGNPGVDLAYKPTSGTSPATAATAGLAAYMLAQGDHGITPAEIKQAIIDLAWVRQQGGPVTGGMKGIFNGIRQQNTSSCIIMKKRGDDPLDPDEEACDAATTTTMVTSTRSVTLSATAGTFLTEQEVNRSEL
ncbi:subtilisin-like protein [Lindgomyces ingoldianus]|uniref:Subtilisin-like protein n=1 Tax=Lindgomyces ingoldianus TaxID=673940 RepID=A0ACB6QA32_9PLEO|nr:subtilisin-like protein [Lindgomyces ingoldianus]KAF2462996.1 subtilisin-like protein [Lindgomyces ingoldianus]